MLIINIDAIRPYAELRREITMTVIAIMTELSRLS